MAPGRSAQERTRRSLETGSGLRRLSPAGSVVAPRAGAIRRIGASLAALLLGPYTQRMRRLLLAFLLLAAACGDDSPAGPRTPDASSIGCGDGVCSTSEDADTCAADCSECDAALACPGARGCCPDLVCRETCAGDGECACDIDFECTEGCACDPECTPTCDCDIDSTCTDGCACDPECSTTCDCDVDFECTDGCACDPECSTTCDCDVDSTCTDGCACDPECSTTCDCDVDSTCTDGCACDPECSTTCDCDVDFECTDGCACDPECGSDCSCDTGPACQDGCSCDPDCTAGCACDLSAACDTACSCDDDCAGASPGDSCDCPGSGERVCNDQAGSEICPWADTSSQRLWCFDPGSGGGCEYMCAFSEVGTGRGSCPAGYACTSPFMSSNPLGRFAFCTAD